MSDPVIVGGGAIGGLSVVGLLLTWVKKLDTKKQDMAICAEKHKIVEHQLAEQVYHYVEGVERDKATSKDIFDIKMSIQKIESNFKLNIAEIQSDLKQLLKNGGSNGGNDRSARG